MTTGGLKGLVRDILERLLADAGLECVLLFDKSGECLASCGDPESMEMVAETHFHDGVNLAHLCRDANGSTVVSESSADAVRFEAVAGGRWILTLVSADPMAAARVRAAIDSAKQELNRLFERYGDFA